jgi:hypothetical protein
LALGYRRSYSCGHLGAIFDVERNLGAGIVEAIWNVNLPLVLRRLYVAESVE